MGLDSRDYYQEPTPEYRFGGPPSFGAPKTRLMVTQLVIANVIAYVIAYVIYLAGDRQFIDNVFALQPNIFFTNWYVWQVLTYGFLHSLDNVAHILGNMFVLWFFGREVESVYGRKKFLAFYLSSIILSGVIGSYLQEAITAARTGGEAGPGAYIIGASGGVFAVLILYVCLFPRRTIRIYLVLRVRAWILAVGYLVLDFIGTFSDSHIAHGVHLAGAACGWVYFKTNWDLSRLLPTAESVRRYGRRRKVRIHRPETDSLAEEVDRILAKINREGEASLSAKERRTLERASQQYKDKDRQQH